MEGIYVPFTEHKFIAFSSIWTVSCLSVRLSGFCSIMKNQNTEVTQGRSKLMVMSHFRWPSDRGCLCLHRIPTYISTRTYILVQISSATALQEHLFTHCTLVSTEQFQMRPNWKMPFCCQWECCARRVQPTSAGSRDCKICVIWDS